MTSLTAKVTADAGAFIYNRMEKSLCIFTKTYTFLRTYLNAASAAGTAFFITNNSSHSSVPHNLFKIAHAVLSQHLKLFIYCCILNRRKIL